MIYQTSWLDKHKPTVSNLGALPCWNTPTKTSKWHWGCVATWSSPCLAAKDQVLQYFNFNLGRNQTSIWKCGNPDPKGLSWSFPIWIAILGHAKLWINPNLLLAMTILSPAKKHPHRHSMEKIGKLIHPTTLDSSMSRTGKKMRFPARI